MDLVEQLLNGYEKGEYTLEYITEKLNINRDEVIEVLKNNNISLKENDIENNKTIKKEVNDKILNKAHQIKFTFGIFVVLSTIFVGVFITIGMSLLLFISWVLGTLWAKVWSKLVLKEEVNRVKTKVIKTEEMDVIKKELKEDTDAFKKWLDKNKDYSYLGDFFSKVKIPNPKETKEKKRILKKL